MMTRMNRPLFWWGAACLLLLWGCTSSPYERTLKAELASGVRQDSLFLGLYLGMPAEGFYARCTELNQQKLVQQGSSELAVQYLVPGFKSRTFMRFYPTFTKKDDVRLIYEMPVLFEYEAWAPWSPQFSADSLLPEVLTRFNQWYGGEFLRVDHPEKESVYVKITGNRRVLVFRYNDQQVKAVITDMLTHESIKTMSNLQSTP
jgi:hypothetical protein